MFLQSACINSAVLCQQPIETKHDEYCQQTYLAKETLAVPAATSTAPTYRTTSPAAAAESARCAISESNCRKQASKQHHARLTGTFVSMFALTGSYAFPMADHRHRVLCISILLDNASPAAPQTHSSQHLPT
jgi:hypothetical protein